MPSEVETESLQVLKFPSLEIGALSVQSQVENVCAMLEQLEGCKVPRVQGFQQVPLFVPYLLLGQTLILVVEIVR